VYAVLVTGGKQYKAQVGQVLTIEKLDVPAGQDVSFENVLMISDDSGVTVGTPTIAGASVSGKVVRQDRGPKIIVFKYKPKVRYRRKTGHRQYQTHVLVKEIQGAGRSSTLAARLETRAEEPAQKIETGADETAAVTETRADEVAGTVEAEE
jgi:large subunit ribosomal protein L21